MKKLLFLIVLFLLLSTNTHRVEAACGFISQDMGGLCDKSTGPGNAVNCPGNLGICCDEVTECPAPGTKGAPCLTGGVPCAAGLICDTDNVCKEQKINPNEGGTSTGTASIVGKGCPDGHINTAIGCIPLGDTNTMAAFFLRWGVGIAGGIALLMIGFASYKIATSQGDPRRLQGGQELLLSAIGGLLMLVLSVYLLRFIGVDILMIF